jgi:hypothetical protein
LVSSLPRGSAAFRASAENRTTSRSARRCC